MIERKIGERFEVDGKIVECVESDGMCYRENTGIQSSIGCAFEICRNGEWVCDKDIEKCGACHFSIREDGKDVCFIEVKE